MYLKAMLSCTFVIFWSVLSDASGVLPEGFSILAERSGFPIVVSPGKEIVPAERRVTEKDLSRGFIATRSDTAGEASEELQWSEQAVTHKIRLLGVRGEYRNFAIALYALKDLNKLNFKLSGLCGHGGSISESFIDVRRVVSYEDKKYLGHFLEKDFPFSLKAGNSARIWGTVFIPENAGPGNYAGQLEIFDAEQGRIAFDLNLLVLDFDLRQAYGNWGVILPGHFADNKDGIVFCTPFYDEKNIGSYFKFLKALRFNTVFFFNAYPELELVDGKASATFHALSVFARAVKENMNAGRMVFDTRSCQSWAYEAAGKYEKMKAEGKDVAGRIKVNWLLGAVPSLKAYTPFAISLFSEIIMQLLNTAAKEKWPDLLLLPEEEVGSHHTGPASFKTIGYETFTPVLKRMLPEKILIVDNDIGYGRKEAIDRGARDGLKYRMYNSWEEAALENAARDNAEIWNYASGFSRVSYGFLQQRLGSKGCCQWADQWGRMGPWVYSIITDQGIISSTELEQSREGRFEYDYCNTLRFYVEKLRKAGFLKEAGEIHGKLEAMLAEVPIRGPEFGQWKQNVSSGKLDNMRWMIVLDIQRARRLLGEEVHRTDISVTGVPSFSGLIPFETKTDSRKFLILPYAEKAPCVDGVLSESCWRLGFNSTGSFSWMRSKEITMRANASSEEEFRRMQGPSYASASFSYDSNGIYAGLIINHISPANDKVSKRQDNDADLWKDNCIELFFKLSSGEIYHFIVNTYGKKMMATGSRIIDSSLIRTAVSERPDGCSLEIFIPWTAFGRQGAPLPGEVWLANAGREFHSWHQMSSWGRVYDSFWEVEKWGALKFSGAMGLAEIKPDMLGFFPGKNRMSGHVAARAEALSVLPGELFLIMSDGSGKVVSSTEMKSGKENETDFSIDYTIPCLKSPEEWSLALKDSSGKELGNLKLPMQVFKNTVVVNSCPAYITSGDTFPLEAMLCVGNLDISDSLLKAEFVSKDNGKVFAVREIVPTMNGECRIWVDSSGVPAGKYVFKIWLSRKNGDDAAFEKEMEVLPPY